MYHLENNMEHHHHDHNLPDKSLKTYWPLILVLLLVVGGTFHLGWVRESYETSELMIDFMGLFFLMFSFFKLLDLPGFAMAYRSYDIPTKLWPTWGYIYPFLELIFAMLYLHRIELFWTNLAVIAVLSISIISVVESVMQKRKIQCACLGTGFNLPMSQVTIIEDGAMILMAMLMLLM